MDIELSIIKEEQYDTNYGRCYLCRLCEEEKLKNRELPQTTDLYACKCVWYYEWVI